MGCGCRGNNSTSRPRTGGVTRTNQSRTPAVQVAPPRNIVNAKADINRRRREAIRNALGKG